LDYSTKIKALVVPGMTAPQAAGVIHSDFEKGFIRAETVSIYNFELFVIYFSIWKYCKN